MKSKGIFTVLVAAAVVVTLHSFNRVFVPAATLYLMLNVFTAAVVLLEIWRVWREVPKDTGITSFISLGLLILSGMNVSSKDRLFLLLAIYFALALALGIRRGGVRVPTLICDVVPLAASAVAFIMYASRSSSTLLVTLCAAACVIAQGARLYLESRSTGSSESSQQEALQ
jgi:hypothetical protein